MLEAGGGIHQEPIVSPTGEKPSMGGLSSIVRKSLPKGKPLTHKKKPTSKTPSLTGEGKLLARTLFEEAKSSLGTEAIQDETKAVRKEINDFLSSTKKIVRGELRAKWQEEGKKLRGNAQQFKEELERQMEQDEYVQDAKIQRKLLTSIKQIARLEQTKEEREKVRNYLLQWGQIEQITKNGKQTFRISQNETELTSFKTERFKTKIPYDPLIINAFINHRLKEEKEKSQISEVQEKILPVQPEVKLAQELVQLQQEPVQPLPEDEVQKRILEVRRMQNERAQRLIILAKQRESEKEKQIAQRLGSLLARTTKNLTHEVKAMLDQIKQKPMQTAMATLMITTIGATTLGILKEGPAVRTAFAEGTNAIAAMVTPTKTPDTPKLTKNFPSPVSTAESKQNKELDLRNPYFGIRNDSAEFMGKVSELGAKNVRIDGGPMDLLADGTLRDKNVEAALKAAEAENLRILFQFNPQKLMPAEDIAKRLKILSQYQNVDIELGNEPDDLNVPFWKDRDLKTFAQFIKTASEEAWKLDPNKKIVVGGLVDESNIVVLVNNLREQGVDINKLVFGIHAYHAAEEVEKRAEMVKNATGGAKVMFTEIGVNNNSADSANRLKQMFTKIRKYSQDPAYMHKLVITGGDPVTNEVFGLIHLDGSYTDNFYKVKEGVGKMSANSSETIEQKMEESTVKQKIIELTAEYPGVEGARKLKVPTPEEFAKEVVNGNAPKIEYTSVIGEFDYVSYFAAQPKEIREKLADSYADSVVDALEKTYGSKSLLVFVEPGHRSIPLGGKGTIDTGTGSAGMREKDVNVEISKKIGKKVAEKKQWTVVVSGDYETEKMSNDGSALNSREALGPLISGWQKLNDNAKKDSEVIKISVHMNGSSVPNARNGEVYYQTVGESASEEEKSNELKSKEFAKNLAISLQEETKKVIPDYSARQIADNPNDQYITLKGDKKFKEFFTSNLQFTKSRFASVLTSNKT